ncbi:MAG: ImmA/IrrE family metallo-endopeptidase [Clostridia bacterium]|nr:ImmA/IrrE family metallo-endopeptidase [Clostridia bacterium]MBQ2346940.1 ImmA/IrrE family metallo-endopeptidase [Clostridia bacterium]
MEYIKKRADSIKKKYHTQCPFEICEYMGIKVLRFDLPDSVNGFYYKYLKNYIIIINANLEYEKAKVTAAHELGHILLHNTTNSFQLMENTEIPIQRLENEADFFASCLLIDETEIKQSYTDQTLTAGDIASISGVPENMVKLYAHYRGYDF